MFRKSYVRGVNKALMDTGAVKYASEELAAEVADQVAEGMPEQPIGEVPPEQTAEIATALVDVSNKLQEAAESAAGAAEAAAGGEAPAPAPAPEAPAEEVKAAAANLRAKLATNPTGSTITGDKPHQKNTEPLSENAEAKMDLSDRPENYANVGEDGVGTQEASGKGAIGDENVVQGKGMGPVGEDGTNTATDAIKGASLRQLIKDTLEKRAVGTTITGDKPEQQNTQAQAAQVTGEGAMEASERPEGYAVKGEDAVGQSDQQARERASAVGTEAAHPGTMGPVGKPGSNTAIQQIPGEGATGKTAEDDEWLKRFKEMSAKHAHVLPFWMEPDEKVAAVQYLMSLTPSEAISVANHIEKNAELPAALKEYVAKKKGNGEEKKEEDNGEKKDDKEEGEKKEASLKAGDIVSRLRQLDA
jgi:hypothetical protein